MKRDLNQWIILPVTPADFCQCLYSSELSAADRHRTVDNLIFSLDFLYGSHFQIYDFQGSSFQQNSIIRKINVFSAAVEEPRVQLLFQCRNLPGKRRLGDVKLVCCSGKAQLPRDRKKIAKYTDFHTFCPFHISFCTAISCSAAIHHLVLCLYYNSVTKDKESMRRRLCPGTTVGTDKIILASIS
jgi:hypothetical protein